MDFGAPVASGVDVSPEKGFETIGSLIGLQSKQIGLKTQAAESQMKQQDAAQRAALANIDYSKHIGSDGVLDTTSFAQDPSIRKAAGDFYPQALEQANTIRQGQLVNKQSLFNLNKDQLGAVRQTISGLQGDDDVQADNQAGRQKVSNALDDLNAQYGEGMKPVTSIFARGLSHVPKGDLGKTLQTIDLQANDVGKQLEMTTAGQGQVDTGGTVQPGTVGARIGPTPGAFTPQGNPVKKTPGPADLPGFRAAVTGATGAAQGDVDRLAQISQANTTAQSGSQLADQVTNLADQVRTGKLTKDWADRLTIFQQQNPGATARQMLAKYAAQLKTQAISGAPTDNARDQINAGMPDPDTMDPDAIKEAAQYMKGGFRVTQARSRIAQKYQNNPVGLRAVDDQFVQHADPLVYAYKDLPPGPARQEFLKKHFGNNPEGAKELGRNLSITNHYEGQ